MYVHHLPFPNHSCSVGNRKDKTTLCCFFWVHDRDFEHRPRAKQWLYKGILRKWHHLISYMFQQKSEPPFAYTYSLFQISDASPCHFKGKRGTCFFFNPHESDGFGLRWIVFTKVRALSCGQWVSQLHLLRKMAGIFRNSSIESSDPSSSCSKNSLKYGSVCACVFLLHWNLKNSWNRSMILFLLQEFWQTGEFQTCDKNTWYVLPDADRKWWKNRGARFVLKGKSWGHLVTGFAEKYGKSQVQGHKKRLNFSVRPSLSNDIQWT